MTTLREAAEMALRSMEEAVTYAKFARAENYINPDAIKSLREALAEPEQEPVADTESDVLTATYMLGLHAGKKAVTKRKPLTVEQLRDIREHQRLIEELGPVWAPMLYYFCQAIERAHGIGGEE